MSIPVTISGTTYNIPEQGQSPPWGDDLSSLLVAITNSINSTTGSSDILVTSFNLTNGQATPANVNGLVFSNTQVRSAIVSYSIYISTNVAEYSEVGQLFLTYKSTANTWDLSQTFGGSNSGVTFTITNSGQVQYTSTTASGTGYVGKLKFKAQSFLQT